MNGMKTDREIADSSLNVPADPFPADRPIPAFSKISADIKKQLLKEKTVDPDSLIASNPDFYQAYELAGNEMFQEKRLSPGY